MKLFSRKIPTLKIFEGIEESTVEEILAHAEKESFLPWEVILEEWAYPDGKWYIIHEWSVNVSVAGQNIAKLHSGNMFGEIALLNEEVRSATVTAETEVQTVVLSQDILFQMIENDNNTINKEIMRRMEENLESQ